MENQITKNFTLAELTRSDTAKARGIQNIPNEEEYKNMVTLCKNILQPLREKLGKPITVNSCFRCSELNKAVGGAKNSQHLTGSAADIVVKGISIYDLANFIKDNFEFDQCILEYNVWVHVSYKTSGNRNQCLTINKNGTQLGFIK